MPLLKLDVDSNSTAGITSETVTYVGHFTASVASTTDGMEFDGVYALDAMIDGNWIESEEFTEAGIYPGFNGVEAQYRLRLKTPPQAGKTGEARVNGYDKPPYIPY